MRGGCFGENNIELQLTISGDVVYGSSYQYLDVNNYIKKDVSGIYYKQTQTLVLQEGSVVAYQIPNSCVICIKKYELQYTKSGTTETLQGGWTGFVRGTNGICAPGTIVLSRIKESVFNDPLVPLIHVDTGDIRLDFYDNGAVDGDSISVMVNNNMIVSHQHLSTKPITTYVKIDLNNRYQHIKMIAENLGPIPPNTALLIITAGTKRYRLFLSSTENNTASVRFLYNPEAALTKIAEQ